MNHWWLLAASNEVPQNRPIGLRRFGQDLVVWRDQTGTPHAFQDLCPHRSVKLSLGKVREGCLECPFHGFRFSSEGECVWIPEVKRAGPGIKAKKHRLTERDSYLWIWRGPQDQSPSELPPYFTELPTRSPVIIDQVKVPYSITRAIENQLDTAHLSFVHTGSIGGSSDPSEKVYTFATSKEIRVSKSSEPNAHSLLRFVFPNIWCLRIHHQMYNTLAFVPVEPNSTIIYAATYQTFLGVPVLSNLLGFFVRRLNRKILAEDSRIVSTHPEGSSILSSSNERLLGSDQAIREFRTHWKANYEELTF